MAGVIKMVHGACGTACCRRRCTLDEPSPHVDWSAGAVELLTEARPWPVDDGRPRRAGVSSFGISGTNAHVILEQAAEPERGGVGWGSRVGWRGRVGSVASDSVGGVLVPWVVSGAVGRCAGGAGGRLASRVARRRSWSPADVGWSLVASRSSFEHRAVVRGIGRGTELAARPGRRAEPRPRCAAAAMGGPGRTVFVFPGQGSQWVGMAAELLESSPVFAERMAECEAALAPFVDWSLREVLRGAEGAPGLDRVDVVQPVLWAVMVSLAALWRLVGVVPDCGGGSLAG